MITQKELREIEDWAREMQCEGTNPVWLRAWERLEDAASGLERLIEGSKLRDKGASDDCMRKMD